ncbi:MAG: hypothetical protein KDD35_04535, partial [Bdellovibrionales bacterium]|nr:hypothetical protein [Bdellovibrionales bacterium]
RKDLFSFVEVENIPPNIILCRHIPHPNNYGVANRNWHETLPTNYTERAHQKASFASVKPIIGTEIYLSGNELA